MMHLRIWIAFLALVASSCGGERVRARPVDDAVREGVAFLVASQNADGSWGSASAHGFDIYAPVPGSHHAFKGATTALCVMALREAGGIDSDPAAKTAHAKGLAFLLSHWDVRRQDSITLYNTWTHTYALQALAREYALSRDPRIAEVARKHVRFLEKYETMYGGWNYYDFTAGAQTPASSGTSFGTGAGIVALEEARAAGIEVPEKLIERGLRVIQRCRKSDGSYLYDYEFRLYPLHLANRDKGSLGRAQAPNLALWMHGRLIAADDVRAGLDRMFSERKFLECGRKRQWPHEAYYFNSGYYYYYGHDYAARLIATLPVAERATYAPRLLAGILPFQEPDGSWWDFAMFRYHKPYGTALALLAITLVR
jgi:hypothetical protein